MRCLLLLLLTGLIGAAPAARAEPGAPLPASELSPTQLEERVAALLAASPPEEVRDPLEHARLGLARASAAGRAGDAGAEQRAVDIARAALALAEARAALVRERALLAAATRRGQEAQRRNAASKALLDKTKTRPNDPPAVEARGPDAGAGK
jgi:hypothetical protein